ncbi:MAG: DUF2254 domain-containing protein [Methanomicrobia archaeon]|nr:DUF2254 domain-containing protein [Methanomicrobia archaeon]
MRGKSIYAKLHSSYRKLVTLPSEFRVHILLFAVFFIALLWSVDIFFKEIDVQKTEFLLSALIQSQAAILSIVVSITLIAIQLASGNYSIKMFRVFLDPKRGLFLYYIMSSILFLLWCSITLLIFEKSDLLQIKHTIYFFALIQFMLFYYIVDTIRKFEPDYIINDYIKSKIKEAFKEKDKEKSLSFINSLQQISMRGVGTSNYEVLEHCLNVIEEISIEINKKYRSFFYQFNNLMQIMEDLPRQSVQNYYIFKKIIDHFGNIFIETLKIDMGRKDLLAKDGSFQKLILFKLRSICHFSIDYNQSFPIDKISSTLRDMTEKIIRSNIGKPLKNLEEKMVNEIIDIYTHTISYSIDQNFALRNQSLFFKVIKDLFMIGKLSVEYQKDDLAIEISKKLKAADIGNIIVKNFGSDHEITPIKYVYNELLEKIENKEEHNEKMICLSKFLELCNYDVEISEFMK